MVEHIIDLTGLQNIVTITNVGFITKDLKISEEVGSKPTYMLIPNLQYLLWQILNQLTYISDGPKKIDRLLELCMKVTSVDPNTLWISREGADKLAQQKKIEMRIMIHNYHHTQV